MSAECRIEHADYYCSKDCPGDAGETIGRLSSEVTRLKAELKYDPSLDRLLQESHALNAALVKERDTLVSEYQVLAAREVAAVKERDALAEQNAKMREALDTIEKDSHYIGQPLASMRAMGDYARAALSPPIPPRRRGKAMKPRRLYKTGDCECGCPKDAHEHLKDGRCVGDNLHCDCMMYRPWKQTERKP